MESRDLSLIPLSKDSLSSRGSVLDRTNFQSICQLSPPHTFAIDDLHALLESPSEELQSFLEADVSLVTCFSTKVVSLHLRAKRIGLTIFVLFKNARNLGMSTSSSAYRHCPRTGPHSDVMCI